MSGGHSHAVRKGHEKLIQPSSPPTQLGRLLTCRSAHVLLHPPRRGVQTSLPMRRSHGLWSTTDPQPLLRTVKVRYSRSLKQASLSARGIVKKSGVRQPLRQRDSAEERRSPDSRNRKRGLPWKIYFASS